MQTFIGIIILACGLVIVANWPSVHREVPSCSVVVEAMLKAEAKNDWVLVRDLSRLQCLPY